MPVQRTSSFSRARRHRLERQRLCCFGNTTVFYFSLLCCRHAHRESTLVSPFSLSLVFFLLLSFFLPSSLCAICSRCLSFSSCFSVSCLTSTLVNARNTHTSNAPSLDINKTLDFLKDSLPLTGVASVNEKETKACDIVHWLASDDAPARSLIAMTRRRVQRSSACR